MKEVQFRTSELEDGLHRMFLIVDVAGKKSQHIHLGDYSAEDIVKWKDVLEEVFQHGVSRGLLEAKNLLGAKHRVVVAQIEAKREDPF